MNTLLTLYMIEQAQGMDRAGGVTATDVANWTGVTRPTAQKYLREWAQHAVHRFDHVICGGSLLNEIRYSDTKGNGYKFKYQITKQGYRILMDNVDLAREYYEAHKQFQIEAMSTRNYTLSKRGRIKAQELQLRMFDLIADDKGAK